MRGVVSVLSRRFWTLNFLVSTLNWTHLLLRFSVSHLLLFFIGAWGHFLSCQDKSSLSCPPFSFSFQLCPLFFLLLLDPECFSCRLCSSVAAFDLVTQRPASSVTLVSSPSPASIHRNLSKSDINHFSNVTFIASQNMKIVIPSFKLMLFPFSCLCDNKVE